jgi:hypothetical protein
VRHRQPAQQRAGLYEITLVRLDCDHFSSNLKSYLGDDLRLDGSDPEDAHFDIPLKRGRLHRNFTHKPPEIAAAQNDQDAEQTSNQLERTRHQPARFAPAIGASRMAIRRSIKAADTLPSFDREPLNQRKATTRHCDGSNWPEWPMLLDVGLPLRRCSDAPAVANGLQPSVVCAQMWKNTRATSYVAIARGSIAKNRPQNLR